MKKLLVLLFVAALIGIVTTGDKNPASSPDGRDRDAGRESGEAARAEEAAAGARPAPTTVAAGQPEEKPVEWPAPTALIARTTEDEQPVREYPSPPDEAVSKALKDAAGLCKAGKGLAARALLSPIYRQARGRQAAALRHALDAINRDLVFNPACLEGAAVHEVAKGDLLITIGRKHGVNWRMIAVLNGMTEKDTLRIGRKLKIIKGTPSIVAWKGEFRLALFIEGAYVKEYPIGIGKGDLTPAGDFVVDEMEVRPPWNPPGGGVIRYGEKGYLLGERWIGFADKPGASGLGIHGTHDAGSIGTKCSRGCLRLGNKDVIELYAFLKVGARIEIRE